MNNLKKKNDIKNRMYYFFDDINVKNLDPNKIKIDEKSYKNILIYYIGCMTAKCVKALYVTINKMYEYIKESNGNI